MCPGGCRAPGPKACASGLIEHETASALEALEGPSSMPAGPKVSNTNPHHEAQ